MLSVSIPNAATSEALVDTATKWVATASAPSEAVSHARADRALVSVSCVVNVFDEITNRVVAGSSSPTAAIRSLPSTLLTKRQRIRS